MLPLSLTATYPFVWVGLICLTVVAYVLYQRFWHPLAKFHGPFWASITNLWEIKHWLSGSLPYELTNLHAKHGPIVRYGPDKLSITSADAVQAIYIKGAKTLPKTEWYNPFGHPQNPNVFNQRDPEAHAVRRRLLLKAFSPQAVDGYEPLIDKHLQRLRSLIGQHSDSGERFDIKNAVYLAVCDINGELLLGEDLHVQETNEPHRLADDHTISKLGVISGAWPAIQPILNLIIFLLPHPRTWRLKTWRNMFSYFAHVTRSVKRRMDEIDHGHDAERKDVLTRVINVAGQDLKGDSLLSGDAIVAETFSFIIAGIHPPSAAMNLLFWHLLHNPEIMKQVQEQISTSLPSPNDGRIFSAAEVETSLPLLQQCVKESHRVTPIFTQPLPRRVMEKGGMLLNGESIPKGTSVAICNYAFHHNPAIWGEDHMEFRPRRWADPCCYSSETTKLLMHFSAGGRQCIGKVLATTLIYKIVATLLSEFNFTLAVPAEQEKASKGMYAGEIPAQVSVGISDLKDALMVRAERRERAGEVELRLLRGNVED